MSSSFDSVVNAIKKTRKFGKGFSLSGKIGLSCKLLRHRRIPFLDESWVYALVSIGWVSTVAASYCSLTSKNSQVAVINLLCRTLGKMDSPLIRFFLVITSAPQASTVFPTPAPQTSVTKSFQD